MSQTYHTPKTQHQIEADGGQGINQNTAEKDNQIGLTGHAGNNRQRDKQAGTKGDGQGLAVHEVLIHWPAVVRGDGIPESPP